MVNIPKRGCAFWNAEVWKSISFKREKQKGLVGFFTSWQGFCAAALWFLCSYKCSYSATQLETYSLIFCQCLLLTITERFCFIGYCANNSWAPCLAGEQAAKQGLKKMSSVKLNCSLLNWLNSPECQTIKRFRKYLYSPYINGCFSPRINSWSANSWIAICS